jgi:capsular exopolysaccharide synthesis family protein
VAANSPTSDSSWLQPAAEQYGLRRFLATMRERALLAAGIAAVVISLAVAYLLTADKVYEAQADILVTPIPAEDQSLAGLGLITRSVDPTLDVQTAAKLIRTNDVAALAADRVDGGNADEILGNVSVEPVGESDVLAVLAQADSAERAAELANAFAQAAVDERSDQLRERLDDLLPQLQAQLRDLEAGGTVSQELVERIAVLQSLEATGDPTLRVENPADPPESPTSPRVALTLVLAVLAAGLLGVGGAYAIHVLDPRLRRDEQLRARYQLPILSRIPLERVRGKRAAPLRWEDLSAAGIESYRALRGILTAPRRGGRAARTFMVTGAQPSEGKSTVAINLAHSLARFGATVLLIEADLRRPAIGRALGTEPTSGVVGVMLGTTELKDAVVPASTDGPGLIDLLLADESGPGVEELFSLPTVEQLIADAERHYDYVVIDTPPLTEVVDALPLARRVDAVLLVVRLGRTRLGRIRELAELLAGSRVRPLGFVVVGETREDRSYYYHETQQTRRRQLVAARSSVSEAPPAGRQQRG